MIPAKARIDKGPAIQPSCAMLHARDRTPEPMTAVIIWAMQVQIVPFGEKKNTCQSSTHTRNPRNFL